MGDRGNIFVAMHPHKEAVGGIYIYSHWYGYRLPELLQAALRKGEARWDDEPYLTRIIAQTVFGDDNGTTGYGLTTYITDNKYPVLVVDSAKQTVGVAPRPTGEILGELFKVVSFRDFIALDAESIEHFREWSTDASSDSRGESNG